MENKTYKVGMCSTVSCGKTTLVKALAELPEFEGFHVATERSKYLRDLGIPLNNDSTLKGQFVFAAERASELMQDKLLTDRTIWDVCAFTLKSTLITDEEKKSFINTAMLLKDNYDLVFYIYPDGIPIEDNGVRTIDPVYREEINQTILNLLELYPPKRLIKIKGSTEERIRIVLDAIKQYL